MRKPQVARTRVRFRKVYTQDISNHHQKKNTNQSVNTAVVKCLLINIHSSTSFRGKKHLILFLYKLGRRLKGNRRSRTAICKKYVQIVRDFYIQNAGEVSDSAIRLGQRRQLSCILCTGWMLRRSPDRHRPSKSPELAPLTLRASSSDHFPLLYSGVQAVGGKGKKRADRPPFTIPNSLFSPSRSTS